MRPEANGWVGQANRLNVMRFAGSGFPDNRQYNLRITPVRAVSMPYPSAYGAHPHANIAYVLKGRKSRARQSGCSKAEVCLLRRCVWTFGQLGRHGAEECSRSEE
jgi:hypothetical protein